MKKEFIPYEEALALKALGFNEPCLGVYSLEGSPNPVLCIGESFTNTDEVEYLCDDECTAPLYQQAFRWFRKECTLHSTITSISQESWQYHITKPGESLGILYNEDYYTYEEAELACLKKLIEIVKENLER